MNNTWIKLYRKILKDDVLFRSRNTFPIWCWLLLMADYKTGVVTCGRHQISKWLKIKPSTVYLTLKRLENLTMIKMKPDNKMTTIHILNWHEYQSKPDNNLTTKQQQNNTNQEYKNKRNNTQQRKTFPRKSIQNEEVQRWVAKKYLVSLKDVRKTVTQLENWLDAKGKTYKDYRAGLCNWVDKRITSGEIKPVSAQMQQYYEQTGRWG